MPPVAPDDRRSLTQRLTVIQYVVALALFRAGGRVLGVPDRLAREVPRDGGEQPHAAAAAAGAARRALRPEREDPRREPEHVQHRAVARADEGHRSDAAHPGHGHRSGRSGSAGDRQSPTTGAELPSDRPHRERHLRAARRVHGAAVGAARDHPTRKCRRADIRRRRSPRICSATSAKSPNRS